MSILTRLVVAFVAIALVLAVPALYGASRLARLSDIAAQQEQNAHASLAVGRFEFALSEVDRLERAYLVSPDDALGQQIQRRLSDMDGLIAVFGTVGYAPAAETPRAKLVALHASVAELHALAEEGRLRDAARAFAGTRALIAQTHESLARVNSEIERRRAEDRSRARKVSSTAAVWTALGVVLALAIALLIAAWAAGAIVNPINRLAGAMSNVADGAFVVPAGLPLEKRDEIGDVSRSFHWMTRRLAEFDRMRAEFVAIASHELKGPIHVIGGYTELLSTELGDTVGQRHRDFLALIGDQIAAATRLLNRLLDISRLEARGFTLSREEVSLEHLFASVTQWMGQDAQRRHVSLAVEIDASAPSTILADPDLLRSEVLGNLVGNALKFTPSGGKVTLHAIGTGGGVRIEVADTGIGIPSQYLPYVFEKYYQVGRGARRTGSGLGLAIARQAVEAHGGRITVASTQGSGTIFSVTLPESDDTLQASQPDVRGHTPSTQRFAAGPALSPPAKAAADPPRTVRILR